MASTNEARVLQVSLGGYVLVFVLKLAVYFVTGVLALRAEAFHTLSDIFVSGFLLVAARYSRKPADAVHMFGYGRAQNAAALVAATLFISFTSLQLYQEALPRLWQPTDTDYQHLSLALAVIVVSMVIAAVPLVGLLRQPRRGAAARAQLMELVNDELGLLAALAGTLFIAWGWPLADPIAALVVATIIAYNGLRLFWENLCVLLGRSPGPEQLAELERLARSVRGVLDVHELRAEYVGPDTIHAGMHIVVERGLPIEEAARIAATVEARLHQDTQAGYCVIQLDAAPPRPTETRTASAASAV